MSATPTTTNDDATHVEYLIARGRTPDDMRALSPQPYITAVSPTTCAMDKNTLTVDKAIELQEMVRARAHIEGAPETFTAVAYSAYHVNWLDRMSSIGM